MSPIGRSTIAFHIGAHKTGTSLIQKYLRDNPRVLRRQRMYYLSRSAMNTYVGWGDALVRDPLPLAHTIRRTLLVPWRRTLIVSHENTLGRPFRKAAAQLYPRAPEILGALERLLRPYRAKVLLSVRPQDELLESYYLQSVHEGRYKTFAEWLDGIDLDAISWTPLVEQLVETFGRQRVEILDFRLIKQGQEAFIREFFARIDPGRAIDVRYGARRNPSISDKGLRMALAANPHLKSGAQRKLMRGFLQKHFSNVQYPRPVLLSDDQKAWLRQRYAAEYEHLVAGGEPAGLAEANGLDVAGR